MEHSGEKNEGALFPLVLSLSSIVLLFTSFYSYLLFHFLVEIFTFVIAFGIFIIAWNSRKYVNNNFLIIIGIGFFFVGALDLIHSVSYKGMGVFLEYDSNLPTQLWIAARYLESISFLVAFLFFKEKSEKNTETAEKKGNRIFLIYAVVFLLLVFSLFYGNIFPDAYREGVGLTPFKKTSEYVISIIFFASIVLLFRKKAQFDSKMAGLLLFSLILKIVSELFFTAYFGVYDFSNMLGHIFKYVSFLLLYKAILEIGFRRPYSFLFLNLKKSEDKLRVIADNAYDLESWIDPEGKYLHVSPSAEKITGYASEEFVKDPGLRLKIVHPDDREIFENHVHDARDRRQETANLEYRIIKKNGEARWISHACLPVYIEGKFSGTRFSDRDVTDIKNTEKALRETQEELRKKAEGQLVESYQHLGTINRKISILLDLEKHSRNEKSREDVIGYILSSLRNLSQAKAVFLYRHDGNGSLKLVSQSGLEEGRAADFIKISLDQTEFAKKIIQEGVRVNGSCELIDPGCFNKEKQFSYFIALPLTRGDKAKGFIFLGFADRKSMDGQELEFLDVFALHTSFALANRGII